MSNGKRIMQQKKMKWILGFFGAILYIIGYVLIAFTQLHSLWFDIFFLIILTPLLGISVGIAVTAYEEIRYGWSKWRTVRERVHESMEKKKE